jgi:hypothetical protein
MSSRSLRPLRLAVRVGRRGGQQGVDDLVAGLAAAGLEELGEVVAERQQRRADLLRRGAAHDVETAGERVAPRLHPGPVAVGDAEDLADDDDRQHAGVAGHQLEAVLRAASRAVRPRPRRGPPSGRGRAA